jgi:hypothetical protein
MMTQKCADPECNGDLKQEEKDRLEGGRTLPYRYHVCVSCGQIAALDEDLKWNAEQMQKFYGEVRAALTWRQRLAIWRSRAWCLVVNSFYWLMFPNPHTWYLTPVVLTDIAGDVLRITASDAEHRIIRVFWEK